MTPRRLSPVVFGALLILTGLGWLLDRAGVLDFRMDVFLAAALIVVGAALMWGSREADQGGLLALGIILSLVTAAVALTPVRAFSGSVGDRTVMVTQLSELTEGIELGVGSLDVDLRDLLVTGDVAGTISVGLGEARVQVPADVPLQVSARSGIGGIKLLGQERAGIGMRLEFRSPDHEGAANRLTLIVEIGVGEIEVTR